MLILRLLVRLLALYPVRAFKGNSPECVSCALAHKHPEQKIAQLWSNPHHLQNYYRNRWSKFSGQYSWTPASHWNFECRQWVFWYWCNHRRPGCWRFSGTCDWSPITTYTIISTPRYTRWLTLNIRAIKSCK